MTHHLVSGKGYLLKHYFQIFGLILTFLKTKLYKAFGFELDNLIPNNILLIGKILISSESFSDFLNNIDKSDMTVYWNFLKTYDSASDVKFKESYKNRQDKFDYSDKSMISDFKKRWDFLNEKPELKNQTLNELIAYFAETFLAPNAIFKVNFSMDEICKKYNHSIDFYLLCIGYYSGTKIIFKNAPSKNDYFDLNHLMYLPNQNNIIVSNDKMLFKIMEKIFPNNLISTSACIKLIEK